MILNIKNMVCRRCTMAVSAELEKLGIAYLSVELGEVRLAETLTEDKQKQLSRALLALGFEMIDDKKSKVIARIKTLIIDLVHHRDNDLKINLSAYIAADLNQEYSALSHLFSEVEGRTIEHYFISQKIEKVKELLTYDELSLSEIAWRLNYSSVAHLSNQFKKITGLAPTHFKQLKHRKRRQLDDL